MATQQIGGIVSGLETADIIEALLSSDQNKITALETKVTEQEVKLACYQSINSLLSTYAASVTSLADVSLWNAFSAASSNSDALSATANEYATTGTYTFNVLQLASTAQYMSSGFSDKDSTAVSPSGDSVIRIDSSKSYVTRETELADLNGGSGVSRGSIRITDKSGETAVIDLSSALTLQDAIDAINDSGLGVEASVATSSDGSSLGCSLCITDTTGGSGTLKIANASGSSTATDLGIAGNDASTSGSVTGKNIYGLTATTKLAALHDGLGVEAGTITISDATSGSEWTVDLSEAASIADVQDMVSEQTGGAVSVSIGSDGQSLCVTGDTGSDLTISGDMAETLGIAATSAGESLTGSKIIADLNSVQISSLSGVSGTGINGTRGDGSATLGTFTATVGSTTVAFDLSSLTGGDSLSDILGMLNQQAANQLGEDKLVFSTNATGNGIQVENYTSSSVSFADTTGTTAADLGLTSSSVTSGATLNGGDLDLNYIGRATLLSSLNDDGGISSGSFLLTDASGFSREIDITEAETMGDVIDLINSSGLDVTARINDTGDGILIEESDDSTGTGTIKVEEVDGTTADELGLLGSGTIGTDGKCILDGSYETAITIDSDDTLTDVMNKIADQSGLTVSIINDGSGSTPYRLVITGEATGAAYDFALDTDLFSSNKVSAGQDAILLYGDTASSSPVLLRSSTNTNSDAILGLTLNLTAVSDEAVTITISQDTDAIVTAVEEFVDTYNALVDLVNELDQYLTDEEQEEEDEDSVAGLLYNDNATRTMMRTVKDALFETRSDCGDITSLFDLGLSFDTENYDGTLEFDSSTLEEWLASDFSDVKKFLCNTENAAASSNGGIATASCSGASGTSVANLINGNTNANDFGVDNGYEASETIANGGDTVTVTFGEPTLLNYLTIYHIDSDDMPAEEYALSDFTVEYLDAASGKWVTLREVTDNTSAKTVLGLTEPTEVTAVRITASATNASDDIMRLMEINCYADTGLMNAMATSTDALTDDTDGYFATLEETADARIEDYEDSIDKATALMEMKEQMLWTKYTAMESTLSALQSQSDYMSSMISSLSSDE